MLCTLFRLTRRSTQTSACWCADGFDRYDNDYLQRLRAPDEEAEAEAAAAWWRRWGRVWRRRRRVALCSPRRLLAYRLSQAAKEAAAKRSKGVMVCELGGLKSAAHRLHVRSTCVHASWLTDALELRIICFRLSLASGAFFPPPPLSLSLFAVADTSKRMSPNGPAAIHLSPHLSSLLLSSF